MTKPRYIFIILILNYAVMLVVSSIIELHFLSEKAKEVQLTVRTAADMALEQSQVIDDFLNYGGREGYKLIMPRSDGTGFEPTDLFGGVFNLDSNNPSNSDKIYRTLYTSYGGSNDFQMLSMRSDAMRSPVRYYNYPSRTHFTWYYIPKVAMMGTDILPVSDATTGVKDVYGNYVPTSFAQEILSAYRLDSHIKYSGGEPYYNTPLSYGFTYLNKDLLGSLFMNNMDLLMRLKYDGTSNLNTEEGGHGILKGQTYADKVSDSLAPYNPINNGVFSLLRGEQNPSVPEVESYKGVTPLVTYKVIDMYDPDNDTLLVHVFGANTEGYPSKAEYLKSLDQNVLNPVTGQPYNEKPIVVAKVTFYADIVVPYTTLLIRDIRSAFGDETLNFLEVTPDSPTGVNGVRRISYTRYFAVTS